MISLHELADGGAQVALSLACSAEAVRLNDGAIGGKLIADVERMVI